MPLLELTAAEGADHVAARGRQPSHAEHEDPVYTCEACGTHEFLFVTTRDLSLQVQYFLHCQCERAENFAATRDVLRMKTVRSTQRLEADHRPHADDDLDGDEVEDEREEEQDTDTGCEYCLKHAEDDDWELEALGDWEVDEDGGYFEVRCAECDHEVEFGWSHPDRGGRIWPVESSDFNPWKTCPEERFVADWARRGWLRPGATA